VGTSATTSYTDTGLSAWTVYSYTVSAYDAASNNSAQSSPAVTARTLDTTAPSVPTGVTATAQSETSILVSWTASTDNIGVTGYKVYRNASQVGTSATTSYTDTGLTANTCYSYTVSAYDAANNNSAQSSPAVVKYTIAPTPTSSNVTCNKATSTPYPQGTVFTFTNTLGFGTGGKPSSYKHAWDMTATHTFTGGEATWNSGTLARTGSSAGSWYLHVQAMNGDGVGNATTLDLGPYVVQGEGELDVVKPVTLPIKSLRCGKLNEKTPGVTGGTGLNDIGLLVRVSGKVLAPLGSDYFYMDDGSAIPGGGGRTGVKVKIGPASMPGADDHVVVTGILSVEEAGGQVYPVILVRRAGHIQTL